MVKKYLLTFLAAGMALSVLLYGCEGEGRGDIIFVGSAGAEGAASGGPAESGTPTVSGSSAESGTPVVSGGSVAPGDSMTPGAAVQLDLEPTMMRVYVCGAVVCPGVVEIPMGSRIEDALSAAGGFLPDAFREAVNLAGWAEDGQMLYFPTTAEAAEWKPVQEGQGSQDKQGDLVNINTAGAALLCTLPGIGEAKAADIIAYREAHGGFASCEDIMKVSGIKTSIYEKICDKITVK